MDLDLDAITAGLASVQLSRGERYSVDGGIRRLELEERWSWAPAQTYDSTRYLDASCLVFGPNRQFIEVVDYQSKRNSARSGGDGAIRHSGDMLRSVLCEGTHTISVDLDRLDPAVAELFISLSAWAGARLGEIRCPSVTLTNPDTRAPLCEYRLEGVPKDALDTYSSVVMCRVFRGGAGPAGGGGGWQVEAVGQLGHGHADAYDPLLHCIRHELALADTLAGWKM